MMKDIQQINIDDYDYELPDHRIARFPAEVRDEAKLLEYRKGKIGHRSFRNIPELLPADAMLVFNNTRVIHARLHLTTPTGAKVEVLCLEPLHPQEYQLNFSNTGEVRWKALIGNNKRWKRGPLVLPVTLAGKQIEVHVHRIGRLNDAFEVGFTWADPELSFGELLAAAGIIPLPPYLNREATDSDVERYQTIYAQWEGSVAAPTAGLHFTDRVFEALDKRGIQRRFVTLHVGAGTFLPVKTETIGDHHMHEETIRIEANLITELIAHKEAGNPIIPIGTTSTRLLESVYWFGAQLLHQPALDFKGLEVGQWTPYTLPKTLPGAVESLQAVEAFLRKHKKEHLEGQTTLMIAPGYSFGMIDGLITNFHQPKSTLLLLIAAVIGPDWKKVYQYALDNDFRFLSFGDSSLLLP